MTDNRLPASCNACHYAWEHPVALPMDMSDFVKAVKKVRCPKCAGKSISLNFGEPADLSRAQRDYRHG